MKNQDNKTRKKLKQQTYFNMALDIAKLSKDQRGNVGAIIIDTKGKVVSSGYNGPACSCDDTKIDFSGKEFTISLGETKPLLSKDLDIKVTKNAFMLHAEMNAILTVDDRSRLEGASIFITHIPCDNCAKLIAQSNIKNVYALNKKTSTFLEYIYNTLAIFKLSNINFEIFPTDFTATAEGESNG